MSAQDPAIPNNFTEDTVRLINDSLVPDIDNFNETAPEFITIPENRSSDNIVSNILLHFLISSGTSKLLLFLHV